MDNKITYTVVDPMNNYHTVQFLKGQWYGMENIVMTIDDPDIKWYTIRQLKQRMLVEVEGKWQGFEWVPID